MINLAFDIHIGDVAKQMDILFLHALGADEPVGDDEKWDGHS